MKKNAFTSKQACYLSGCTSHQLRYWDKVNLVSPSVQSSDGKPGVPKFYSFRDIVALRVIKTLLDNGMSIQRVRRAWKYLTKNGDLTKHLSEVKLKSDGQTIYSVSIVSKNVSCPFFKASKTSLSSTEYIVLPSDLSFTSDKCFVRSPFLVKYFQALLTL